MKWFILYTAISTLILSACEDKQSQTKPIIGVTLPETPLRIEDRISFKINDPSAELVSISVNNTPLSHDEQYISLRPLALGKHEIVFRLKTQSGEKTEKKSIAIFASTPPKKWKSELIATYTHNTDYYTQGLEFVGDTLYESTGQKGRSVISAYNPFTNQKFTSTALDAAYFGEGITILNDRVIQLTWQARKGFIYERKSLKKLEEFAYGASSEGWGLAHDQQHVYKSDGTEFIYKLDPKTLQETDYFTVSSTSAFYKNANELEVVDDLLFANVYQKNSIMIINKHSGALEGVIDLGYLEEQLTKDSNFDPLNSVLNGIAYHSGRQSFFVTGKNWNLLFEMKFIPAEE